MGRQRRRLLGLGMIVALAGCGTAEGPEPTTASLGQVDFAAGRTVDGLVRAEIDAPGVLFLRDDHGIGSYDAFLIPASQISYRRQSKRLPPEMETAFLASLEQSLVDAAEDAEIPVADAPGECVMRVAMDLVDVSIDRRSREAFGRMTLVMEFRDTVSGAPLLRYATENQVPAPAEGTSGAEHFRTAFDGMVMDMEISGALRAAGLGDASPRPGCRGTLAERGARSRSPVSAR